MIKYTDYNFWKREGIDFKEVYDYCKDILKCDSIEELKEKFSKYLPEFLEIGSINKFVYSMIDKIYPNDDQHQASSLKLLYMESQLLSHGNGYMLSSNYGSFMDRFSAINAIDILIDKFYEKVGDVIEEKAKEDSSFKKANYDFSKLYSNYKNKKDIKNKILHSLIEKKIG